MRTVYNSPIAFRHCRISQVKQLLNGDIAYQASLVSGRHNIKPVNPQSGRVTLFIFPIGEADRVLGFSRRLYRFRALGALNVNNHIILNTIQNGIAIRDSVAFRRAHASFSHKVANGHVARQSGTNGAYHRINRVTSGNAVVHRAFPEVERNLFGRRLYRFRALGALNVNNHIILNTIQNGIAIRDSVAFRRAHASFSHKVANGHVARQSGTNGAYHRINRVTSGNAVVHRAFPEVERNLFGRSRFRSCNRCTIACSKRRNRNANAKHQHCYTAR